MRTRLDTGAVRDELRDGESTSLRRRRRIALLSVIGMLDFAVITLYQIGVIRHLPDLPGRVFDSDRVNGSRKAYMMGVPDGTLGATLCAATTVLAAAGGSRATGRAPVLDVLLGGAVVVGAGAAVHYLWDMARRQQKACPYCIVAAGLHFAMLPPAVAGAREGLRAAAGRARARR